MSVRIVCVVCGIEHGLPDDKPLQGVCAHQACTALVSEEVTAFTIRHLYDKAARRATYVENLDESDSDEMVRLAVSRYQRARKRAMYATSVYKNRGENG
jgi:hypothetical protein